MPILPSYENEQSLQVPNFAQVPADTSVGSALSSLGAGVEGLAGQLSLDQKSAETMLNTT